VEAERPELPDYESTPLSRAEYISAIVHLYRGEMYRATAWRIRLDTTTNWAVLTTAGLLAFAFREDSHSHWVLLFGTILITLLMGYEARRYQVFDVWRSRVRKIEENFYGPILRRNPVSPQREWGMRVAKDLLQPSFKITFLVALRARFLRNYWAIYVVILLSWLIRVTLYPTYRGTEKLRATLGEGALFPWWSPLVFVAVLVALAGFLVFGVPRMPHGDDDEFWTPEIRPGRMLDV
jgi:uncharacterized membrane protein